MNVKKLLKDKSYVNLDIEGGFNPQHGFITMHSSQMKDVDLVWDYKKLPYPFPDSSVDLIRADMILQKVTRENGLFVRFMNELWRILKYDEKFMFSVPYAGSYQFYQDPMNVNPMNECTLAYFDPLEPIAGKTLYKLYKPKPWKINHISFNVNGLMEVLMIKRREDKSYENKT
jgi:SAM-dependent methyltransferase